MKRRNATVFFLSLFFSLFLFLSFFLFFFPTNLKQFEALNNNDK